MKQISKKFITFIILFSLIFPSAFLYKPQKAEAGFFDDAATWGVYLKEFILDPIAYAFINALAAEMSRQAVSWINGNNYTGPSGGNVPGFATNPQSFLEAVGDRALGDFIQQKVPLLCSPFRINIQGYLSTKYKSNAYLDRNYCTFTEAQENVQSAYDSFTQNFNNGGWKRWVSMTVNPINNPYGAVVSADANARAYIGNVKLFDMKELDWGGGFLSWKKEVGECAEFATVSLYDKNGDPFPDTGFPVKGHWVNPNTDEDLGPVSGPAPCVGTDTRKTKIETPGSFVQTGLSDALGLSNQRLSIGDEIDEIIGALLTKLIGVGFNALGLGSADTSGDEDSINNAKKGITNVIKEMTQSTNDYIDIKKRSLVSIGSFDVSNTPFQTDVVEKKVDWNRNNFDWVLIKYYMEDVSSKSDWAGKEFQWVANKHYNQKSDGKIFEEECLIKTDVGRISYVVTNDSNDQISSFWSKSVCVAGTGNNVSWGLAQKLFTRVGTVETEVKNFIIKITNGVCGSNNLGKAGYIVKPENADHWSKVECARNSSNGAYEWSNLSLLTNVGTYAEKTTRSFVKKIDWNGLLFSWTESGVFGGRDLYMPPNEMMISKGRDSHITSEFKWNVIPLTIEDLSTPPKLCFPAERQANQQGVIVYGVKKGESNWTVLECTKYPSSTQTQGVLQQFKDGEGDQDDYGAWNKLSKKPPAYVKIEMGGNDENFKKLDRDYGSDDVRETFEKLLACSKTKYTDTEIKRFESKIEERKAHRLQLIADILLAQKMLGDIDFLENSSNSLGSGGPPDFINFLNELGKIRSSVGFSDEDIARASQERDEIVAENDLMKKELNNCLGISEKTAESYSDGFTAGEIVGNKNGYSDGFSGIVPGKIVEGIIKKNSETTGYLNGYENGYYQGYESGYRNGVNDKETPQ